MGCLFVATGRNYMEIWRSVKGFGTIHSGFDIASVYHSVFPLQERDGMEAAYFIVLITAPDQKVSEHLAYALVESKLAACVNIISPMTSIYHWQGKIEHAQEYLLLCKTRRDRFDSHFITTVKAIHPYEVPEIIAIPVEAGAQDYLEWIQTETSDQL
ncbi:MAG TPA: divalent-cation tolerance protein CutA [Levilinea sp.]|nr:divalent-cation tolerance protein CutA [Levilinea sp.]